ncbi:hypothetical protein D3C80_1637940 [compost metagenome]
MPTCQVGSLSWASQSGTRVFNTAMARVNSSRPQSNNSTGREYVVMDKTVGRVKMRAHHATAKAIVNRR